MKKIDNPDSYTIHEFDGVEVSGVYRGTLTCMVRANDELSWHDGKFLTLAEIAKQLNGAPLITVIVDRPLSGEILQYGNYGDEWWQVGELDGYA